MASGIRFALASVLILPLAARAEKNLFKMGRSNGIRIAAMAFCGQFVFTLLMLLGLRYTSAIEAGMLLVLAAITAMTMASSEPAGSRKSVECGH